MKSTPRARWIAVVAFVLGGLAVDGWGRIPAGPELEWRNDLEAVRSEGQPALVSFHANWCSNCLKLDRRTLQHPEVAAALEGVTKVRVDVSQPGPRERALMREFGVEGFPTLVGIRADGRILAEPRVLGYAGRDRVLALVNDLTSP